MKLKMWILHVAMLITYICTEQHVVGETFYIITTPSSFCLGEFNGEPCLTLQQYVTTPNRESESNITLMLEPGIHRLHESAVFFNSESSVNNFTVIAENAQITLHTELSLSSVDYYSVSSSHVLFNDVHTYQWHYIDRHWP